MQSQALHTVVELHASLQHAECTLDAKTLQLPVCAWHVVLVAALGVHRTLVSAINVPRCLRGYVSVCGGCSGSSAGAQCARRRSKFLLNLQGRLERCKSPNTMSAGIGFEASATEKGHKPVVALALVQVGADRLDLLCTDTASGAPGGHGIWCPRWTRHLVPGVAPQQCAH